MLMNSQRGSVSTILAVMFGLLFIITSIFGFWAFSEREKYKNDTDQLIEDAVVIAVQDTETEKDAEFTEREKLPTRTFTASATYGSLSFSYPKTWSVYLEESSSGVVVDVYAHPNVIPGFKSEQPYALRAEITSTSYEREVEVLERSIENGSLSVAAFRPEKVRSVLGIKATGEIDREVQGAIVLLPLRDRTIKVYTESREFLDDFNSIVVPSLNFVP